MKNQYFGDINDYRKYGLLRSIISTTKLRVIVAWMLTPDDGSSDGKFLSYLLEREKWSGNDPDLFEWLFEWLKDWLFGKQLRRVSLIENTGLIPETDFFSCPVSDSHFERTAWFTQLSDRARGSDLIFLDPDNGIEVKSKHYGRKYSSKYVYWREIEALWSSGKSLLIYQHFTREKREDYIQDKLKELDKATPGSWVGAFSTPYVVFLLALQEEHQKHHAELIKSVRNNWENQIEYRALIQFS